jgi:guanine deaminase
MRAIDLGVDGPAEAAMSNSAFMRRAVELALEKMRQNGDGPFGAVVVRDDEIIAEGWNQVTATNDPTAHAEIVALRRACAALGRFELPDCEIFANCEPCPMCLGAIYWARLRRIYYCKTRVDAARIGFDDDFIYREIALAPEKRQIPAVLLTDDKADLVFREWASNPGKKPY